MLKRASEFRHRGWEREALIAAVQNFCLTGAGKYKRRDVLRLFADRWPRVEEVASTRPGPYIYAVTWDGVRRLSLPGVKQARAPPRLTRRGPR